MIRRDIALVALVASALTLACEKKEAPPASEPPAAPAAPAAPAIPAATEPVVDVSTLPVEEQYEADAEQEITAANLSQKLDELEKELSAP